jgi:hypothetical protein
MDRDSLIGIATRYELDGQEIESRSEKVIPHLSSPALAPSILLYSRYWGFFPEVKQQKHGVNHASNPAPRLKEGYSLNHTPLMGLHGHF